MTYHLKRWHGSFRILNMGDFGRREWYGRKEGIIGVGEGYA